MSHDARDLPSFAEIQALLRRQRQRIVTRLLWHGAGVCLAALLFGLVVYYLVDRGLVLPVGVRLLVTAVGVAGLGWLVFRHLVRTRRLDLSQPDVAIALEARFPTLREKLISAVQLGQIVQQGETDLRNQSPAMIAKVVEEATGQVRSIPTEQLLTWRHAGRVWAGVGLAALIVVPGALTRPDATRVFLRRALGADEAYPRLTTLHVELPPADQDYQITMEADRATVTMAAGGDLPILVRAEGTTPREVFLAIEGGRGMPAQVATAARGGGRFRHVFRRVADTFEFHARGGDDDRGDLLVTVVTVRPPRVGTIRAALTYPEYTGKPPAVQEGGSIEALEGTAVQLEVAPLGDVASGRLVFQESGAQIDLIGQEVEDDGGRRSVFRGAFTASKSDRYRVDLVSREGLRTPQAASYPVIVLPDAPPGGQVLLPQDDGLNVLLPNAILPVRVLAKDDFDVKTMVAELTIGDRPEPVLRDLAAASRGGRTQLVATELVPLTGLLGPDVTVKEGETITLVVVVTDNRAPEPHATKLPNRSLHVVGLGDLERRIAGHFRRVRTDVEKALEQQRERHDALGILQGQLGSIGSADLAASLTGLQVAQGRLQSMAGRILGELMRSFNLHLFNPMDEGAQVGPALALFSETHAAADDPRALVPEFYRTLAAQRASGRMPPLGKFLDRILAMTATADRIAERLAPECVQHLAGARGETTELGERLRLVGDVQNQIVAELEQLLARLDEWTDFQDVIATTRALQDNQRDVQARTKSVSK
ncbi:MAG: hypothetical protein R3F56_06595 [Planctomycetota bacterium]